MAIGLVERSVEREYLGLEIEMAEEETHKSGRLSRREALRRGAIIGGAVWAAPVIQSLGSRALAQEAGTPVLSSVCADENGAKPTSLVFAFIGGSCTPTDPDGVDCDDCGGTLDSTDLPLYLNWNVGKGNDIKGSGNETLTSIGQQFTVSVPGEDIGNNIAFTICTGSPCANARTNNSGVGEPNCTTQIMHIAVHTSCSAPLEIGDKYGALQLLGGTT